MRPASVVGDDLRDRSGHCQQGVDLGDGGRLVAGLAGRDDRIQPGAVVQRRYQVTRPGPTAGERVPVGQPLQAGSAAQLVRRVRAAGVDQLNAARHRLELISIEMTLTAVSRIP